MITNINHVELMEKDLLRRRVVRLKGSKEFSVLDMARHLDMSPVYLWRIIKGHDKVSDPLQIRLTLVFQAIDRGELVPVNNGRANSHILERREPPPTAPQKGMMPRINFEGLLKGKSALEFD